MGDVVLIPSIKVSHVLWAFHSLYFVFVNAHVNILQKSCETVNKIMLYIDHAIFVVLRYVSHGCFSKTEEKMNGN